MSTINPVLLCGGSGSRLWPLSRQSFPKQFIPLIQEKSLFSLSLERVSAFSKHILCLAAEEHRFLVSASLEAAKLKGTVILEPVARNTAAAMALAALYLHDSASPDDLILFCPSDHHIPDTEKFVKTIYEGVAAAQAGSIITFGINPTYPSTAYGYIQRDTQIKSGSYKVKSFIEKPNQVKAQSLILSGDVYWNAGIFLASSTTLIKALAEHAPDILASCKEALKLMLEEYSGSNYHFVRPAKTAFAACRDQSIDYAVMEHYADLRVLPFNGTWSDVGSWNSLAQLSPADENGNRLEGQAIALHSKNTFIYAPHRPVVALGTEDLLIIDTPDALLVAHPDLAEAVKEVVAILEQQHCDQALNHRKVQRPWGWYDSIDTGARFQVKRLMVKPGATLSLQKHHHRAEHWVVVKGTAQVTRDKENFLLSENESTYIPIGTVHRLSNPGKVDLEMIEIQSGSYLGEDDIVRLEDNYGRTLEINNETSRETAP
jgi:mannose-1-phosphate guanylyltransferase/mannose-6-phosphate isomerase